MASFEVVGRAQLLCLAALLAACGSASEDGSKQQDGSELPAAPAGSLCPRCLAGGETTDFSGDRECAGIDATPIEQGSAVANEFPIEPLLARLEQPIRSPLGWRRRPGGSGASGYERETEVEFQIEVLGLSHGQWRSGGPRCSDFLVVDARIHLETTDAALSGTFESPLLLLRGSSSLELETPGGEEGYPGFGLRDATGALDLGVDGERIYDGSIALQLSLGPDAIRGRLGIYLWYRGEGLSRWLVSPLQAQWPFDGCADGWQRVDPDAPLQPSDGRSARDYWQQHSTSLAETFPVSASWLDGSETEIVLEPGELEQACQELGQPTAYYLRTPLSIRSTDGRLATTQAAQLYFRTDDDSFQSVTVEGEATSRSGFGRDVNVLDLDWAGTSEATFELRSSRTGSGAPSGDLQIFGFDLEDRGAYENLLYLHWCSGAECDSYPRARYSPGGLSGLRLP